MDGLIGGHKRQAVGHFKAFLAEGAALAHAADTEGGFMDQLKGQARRHLRGGTLGPAAKQIPGAQAQMLRDQQPQAELIAGNLIGQQLAHLPLQAFGIGRFGALFAAGALGLDGSQWSLGIKGVEFFFAVRNR